MPSTWSDLKIELMATGEKNTTWGNITNENLGTAIEEAITGSGSVAFAGADITLTLVDSNSSQTARNLRIVLTGTSGGARNLILGAGCQIAKLYIIDNQLADAVTVKNTTGTGTVVPAGKSMMVFNTSTNVIAAFNFLGGLNPAGLTPNFHTKADAAGLLSSSASVRELVTGEVGIGGNATAGVQTVVTSPTTRALTLITAVGGTFGGSPALAISDSTTTISLTPANGHAQFGTITNHPLEIATNGAIRATIAASGEVGIGAAPVAGRLLQVTSSTGQALNLTVPAGGTLASDAFGIFDGVVNFAATPVGASFALGTATSHPLDIMTNNTGRMRIDATGNVGIGGFPVANTRLYVTSPTPFGARIDVLAGGTDAQPAFIIYDGVVSFTATPTTSSFNLGTVSAHPLNFRTSGSVRATIAATGEVGIGAAPVAGRLLQVTSYTNQALNLTVPAGGTLAGAAFGIFDGAVNFVATPVAGAFAIGTSSANPLNLVAGGVERLTLSQAGNYFLPISDGAMFLGVASNRFATIYVATAPVVGSDAREKEWRGGLTDAELRAARAVAGGIGVYRRLAAMAEKGDGARLHVGVTAQAVVAAMEAEGLDALTYGFVQYDELEEGGFRYGVCYEELAMFVAAAQEQRLAALEAKAP